jgi:hypothetical protein
VRQIFAEADPRFTSFFSALQNAASRRPPITVLDSNEWFLNAVHAHQADAHQVIYCIESLCRVDLPVSAYHARQRVGYIFLRHYSSDVYW